jgi:hypothetical protein
MSAVEIEEAVSRLAEAPFDADMFPFAEDTNIFHSDGLFTATIKQMSARDSSNTHEVISELFRSMSILPKAQESAQWE